MKRLLTFAGLFAALAIPGVQSQAPNAAAASPRQMLESVREANVKLLEQQAKTLQLLEEMEKTSQTLKTLGKRG